MSQNPNHEANAAEQVDIAIVGGGVAGLYSGWRLLEYYRRRGVPLPKIGVYELSKRTGGRLLSARPPQMEKLRAELGGMRYLTKQKLVHGLVTKVLKLEIKDFPVSKPDNIAYLRGHLLRRKDLTVPGAVPYKLEANERGKPIGTLVAEAIGKIVGHPDPEKITREQWQAIKRNLSYNGLPIYNQGFWNVLYREMSGEAYELVANASGYDTTLSNWNAADAMPWFLSDFVNAKYVYPVDAMQAIPDGLRKLFVVGGGRIFIDHRLRSVLPTGTGRIWLEFLTDEGRTPRLVDARQVILAMPRRSLELIDLSRIFGPEMARIRQMIRSVTPQPMFKLFTCYTRPWWRELNVEQGQTVTDIPIRQTYYFGTEERSTDSPSLLMATYDDGRNLKYWVGLRDRQNLPIFETRLEEFAANDVVADLGDEEWQRNTAPKPMVDEIQRLLAKVHGVKESELPYPYAAAFRNWGEDPYGGAYNLWKIHEKSWDISTNILKPAPRVEIYICGEAYSEWEQGWVEGAFETAEKMLTIHFKLPPPDWLKD